MANEKDRKYWFLTYYKLRCLENGKVPENSNELKQIINFALQYEKNISSNRAVEYLDGKAQTFWKPSLVVYPARANANTIVAPSTPEIYVPTWPEAQSVDNSLYSPDLLIHCDDNEGFPTWVFFNELVVFNDKMWSIGGNPVGHTGANLTEIFSSTNGANWTLEGNFPVPIDSGVALVFDSKIWYIGGVVSGVGNSRKVYFTSNGTNWSEAGTDSFPYNVRFHTGIVYGGKMWIIGGISGSNTYKKTVYWSTDGTTWTQAGTDSFPYAARAHAGCVHDNKMWVSGGYTSVHGAYKNVYWSTNGETWTEAGTEALPDSDYNHKMVSYDGKLWIVTGTPSVRDPYGTPFQEVWNSADGVNWERIPCDKDTISDRMGNAGVVVYDNKIFVVGDNDGIVSSTVDGETIINYGDHITDSSGNNRHGVSWWLATSIVSTEEGKNGKCFAAPVEGELRERYNDDGMSDIYFPGYKITGGKFFSSMWVRSPGFEDNYEDSAYDPYVIFCQGPSEARAIELKYDNHVYERLEFRITDGGSNVALAYANFIFDNEWHHVVVSWDKEEGVAHIWMDATEGTSEGTTTGELLVTEDEFIYGEDDWLEEYEIEDPYFYGGVGSWEEDLDEWRVHTNIPYTAAESKMLKLWNNGDGIDESVIDI